MTIVHFYTAVIFIGGIMSKDTNRIERKKINTREKIFNAAIKLFQKKGYENTTVDEIVEQADVAKGTFFNYFPKKSSLLIYLNKKRVENLQLLIKEKFNDIPMSCQEKIKKIIEIMIQDNEQNTELSKFLITESLKYYGDVSGEENINQYTLIKILEDILDEGKNTNQIPKHVNSRIVAGIITCTYLCTIFLWISDSQKESLHEDMIAKIELLLDKLLI